MLSIRLEVVGYALVVEGEAQQHALVNVEDRSIHRAGARARFTQAAGEYRLRPISTEEQLAEHIQTSDSIHVMERVKVPRLRYWNTMYWPPSDRVAAILSDRMGAFARGEGPDPRPFDFLQLEGPNILTAWEPASIEYLTQRHGSLNGMIRIEVWWSNGPQGHPVRTDASPKAPQPVTDNS